MRGSLGLMERSPAHSTRDTGGRRRARTQREDVDAHRRRHTTLAQGVEGIAAAPRWWWRASHTQAHAHVTQHQQATTSARAMTAAHAAAATGQQPNAKQASTSGAGRRRRRPKRCGHCIECCWTPPPPCCLPSSSSSSSSASAAPSSSSAQATAAVIASHMEFAVLHDEGSPSPVPSSPSPSPRDVLTHAHHGALPEYRSLLDSIDIAPSCIRQRRSPHTRGCLSLLQLPRRCTNIDCNDWRTSRVHFLGATELRLLTAAAAAAASKKAKRAQHSRHARSQLPKQPAMTPPMQMHPHAHALPQMLWPAYQPHPYVAGAVPYAAPPGVWGPHPAHATHATAGGWLQASHAAQHAAPHAAAVVPPFGPSLQGLPAGPAPPMAGYVPYPHPWAAFYHPQTGCYV